MSLAFGLGQGVHSADPPSFTSPYRASKEFSLQIPNPTKSSSPAGITLFPPFHSQRKSHAWRWVLKVEGENVCDASPLDVTLNRRRSISRWGRWFPVTLHVPPYSRPVAPEGELWGCSKVLPWGLVHLSSLALWSSRIVETVRSRSSSPHGQRLRDRRVDDARQLGRASILSNAFRGSLLQGPLLRRNGGYYLPDRTGCPPVEPPCSTWMPTPRSTG
jgi:hypothetical protein